MTYFAAYGAIGFVTMLIASILFALLIHKIMLMPYNSINELLNTYPFSKIILLIVELFLLVLYSSMLSAGGEILHTIFNLNKLSGAVITAIITIIIIRKGCNSISDLSEVLFIPIVIIIFVICITATEKNIAIPSAAILTPKALLSPFIYVSYNMLTTIPLLISIPNKYMYRSCGNQVGIVIFLLSSMLILPLYTHYSLVADNPLPLMAILSGGVKYLYQVLLMLAIITTAASAAYGLCSTINRISYNKSMFIISIVALIISVLGFSNIVNKVYFIFGVVGLLLLGIVLWEK